MYASPKIATVLHWVYYQLLMQTTAVRLLPEEISVPGSGCACFIIWEFFFLLLVSIPSIAAVWTLCGSSAIVCGRYSTLRQRSASHAQGSFRLGAITCCKAMLKLASYQKCSFITLSLCPPLNISAINGPFRGRPMRPIQPSHCGRQTGPPWLQPTRVCSVPSR